MKDLADYLQGLLRYVWYIVLTFVFVGLCEAVRFIPSLDLLNAYGTDCLFEQIFMLFVGIAVFVIVTLVSCRKPKP